MVKGRKHFIYVCGNWGENPREKWLFSILSICGEEAFIVLRRVQSPHSHSYETWKFCKHACFGTKWRSEPVSSFNYPEMDLPNLHVCENCWFEERTKNMGSVDLDHYHTSPILYTVQQRKWWCGAFVPLWRKYIYVCMDRNLNLLLYKQTLYVGKWLHIL